MTYGRLLQADVIEVIPVIDYARRHLEGKAEVFSTFFLLMALTTS